MYLLAIVLANVTTAIFGPTMSVVNSFLFIGLNISSRDKLHEKWHNNHLSIKMLLLIISGGVLSFLVNRSAGIIALASCISFLVSEFVDYAIYAKLIKKDFLIKSNISNLFSGAVDSMIFPAIAFGFPLVYNIMLLQFLCKVCGGYIWSLILRGKREEARLWINH